MAEKQRDRLDYGMVRKNHVIDEYGENGIKIENSFDIRIGYNSCDTQDTPKTSSKDDDFVETGVHFYTISIMNESDKICFRSFKKNHFKDILFHIACFALLGIPYVFFKWWPSLKCRWLMRPCSFADSDVVLSENSFNNFEINSIESINHPIHGKVHLSFMLMNFKYVSFFIEHGTDEIISSKDLNFLSSTSIEEVIASSAHIAEKYKFFLGKNLIDLQMKSYVRLFVDEVAHPFNVFQIASVLIWLYEDYYLYAFSIFLISIISSGITLYETCTNNKKLRNISRFSCRVKIFQNGKYNEIDSSDLAPGNVVVLDSSIELCPCDLVLIRGDAIVDESMLTGESVPVSKLALQAEDYYKLDFAFNSPFNTIYSGTKLLRSRESNSLPALGLVLKTGFETEKGQLILSILFPKPINFNFYSDSMKYIFILAVIAIMGFIFSLYNQLRLQTTRYYILSRALDLITVVVPPALPATMSIGTVFSLNRLKSKMIHCISPSKINVASKIDVFCFDKTGTLTEEGLDLFGVAANSENLDFKSARYICPSSLEKCMALCHSLQKIDDILVGDFLEIKMFESSKWILDDIHDNSYRSIIRSPVINHTSPQHEFGIIKCFEFCPEIRRTSVLTKNITSNEFFSFCKGSPESIYQICDPSTVPHNFNSVLLKYSKSGYRVIGCAEKKLDVISSAKVLELSRESVESKMQFLGFLIFENKIKKQSPKAICQLSLANIRTLMVTGDNILTAICVARSCGILKPNEKVFLPQSDDKVSSFIEFDSKDTISLQDLIIQPENIILACNGAFLKLLRSSVPDSVVETFVKRCKIFARMSPKDKKMLVELIQDNGSTVGFCGDGANDCGALRSADIGISLSDSEASVAAPFSSNCKNISCVIDVLLEGRASLATSFSCFKFMALYSMIQFSSLILLYCFGSSLSDSQFVYIDLILILPLGMLMSRFQPSRALAPKQPEIKLISSTVLTSLLSQIAYQALAQLYVYNLIINEPGYEVPLIIPGQPNTRNQENTVIFLQSIFLYIFAAIIFCSWRPFRSFYMPFYSYVFVSLFFACFITFIPKFNLDSVFELVPISFEIKKSIIGTTVIYLLLSTLTEYYKSEGLYMYLFMLHRRLFSAANFMNDIAVKKLKYLATKRGIVENELIFEKFVNSHFDKLNGSDLALFDEFLNEYDWDIYAWITEQRKAPEKYLNSNLLKLLKDSTLKK